jgi:hypothetical protein
MSFKSIFQNLRQAVDWVHLQVNSCHACALLAHNAASASLLAMFSTSYRYGMLVAGIAERVDSAKD